MPSADEAARMPGGVAAEGEELQLSPSALDASTFHSLEGKGGHHEKATWYGRELLEQLQLAQARLEALMAEHDATVEVTATTAVPMDDLLRAKTIARCEELFNAPIYLSEAVDPQILGGIVLEGNNRRYDMSVRAELASVRKALVARSAEGEA